MGTDADARRRSSGRSRTSWRGTAGRANRGRPRLGGVRVHVVSDVHGSADALARAGDGADALICLGDLLLFVDYADHGAGRARRAVRRRRGRAGTWRCVPPVATTRPATSPGRCGPRSTDREAAVAAAVRQQYAEMFAAFPDPTYATYGNVDVPDGLGRSSPGRACRCSTARWSSWAAGGSGSSAAGCPRRCGRRSRCADAEFAAKIAAVGRVDVLCSHIPPAVPELLYDTVARRFEQGSAGAAGGDPRHPAAVRPVRARAPAAAAADADRSHRVRQRRPLPRPRAVRGC